MGSRQLANVMALCSLLMLVLGVGGTTEFKGAPPRFKCYHYASTLHALTHALTHCIAGPRTLTTVASQRTATSHIALLSERRIAKCILLHSPFNER